MQRPQLEHIIRATSGITGTDRFVVIGSQAVLGQFPNPPAELLVSIEADLFSLRNPSDAELIDGSIGEGSPFHQTFGCYAHGVAEETAVLPLHNQNTGGGTGLCLEVHDLAVSKLVAGREKDMDYVGALFRHRLARTTVVEERLGVTPLASDRRELCFARLRRCSK